MVQDSSCACSKCGVVRSGGSFVHGVAVKFKMGKWGSLSLSLSLSLFLFVSLCVGVYCVIEGCSGGSKKPQCLFLWVLKKKVQKRCYGGKEEQCRFLCG
jgi:hypothetical protein